MAYTEYGVEGVALESTLLQCILKRYPTAPTGTNMQDR